MRKIEFQKNVPIIIYGAGEVGTKCAEKLISKKYHLLGFLDERRNSTKVIDNYFAYRLAEEPSWEYESKQIIVIICLANGVIHKEVADKLFSRGYEHILFLPLGIFASDNVKVNLSQKYDNALAGNFELVGEVYNYKRYMLPQMNTMNAVAKKYKDFVIAWIGQEIIFSENYDLWEGDKSKLLGISETYDKNICARFWYRKLFDYLSCKTVDYSDYINCFGNQEEDAEKEKLEKKIEDRQKLFLTYRREINKGMDFFIANAPFAIWNDKGYFNLVGGHHRSVFLLWMEHVIFPVKIKNEAFDKWINKEAYDALRKYMIKNHIYQTVAPIPHPAFLNYPSTRERCGTTLHDSIISFLGPIDFSGMNVLDISEFEGYFARIAIRMKATKAECFIKDNYQFVQHLNQLLYMDAIILINDSIDTYRLENKYEISFVMNAISSIKDIELKKILIQKLDCCTDKYMFWETEKNNEKEKEYILSNTGFSQYKQLHFELVGTKCLEMGVYIKL